MFCVPSFDEMTNLTPYFNHVIPAYAGIQTVSHSASQVEELYETGSVGVLNGRNIEFPDRIFRGRCVSDISPNFIQLAFAEKTLRRSLEEKAKSSAGHQRISLTDLQEYCVPLPPLEEQRRIVAEVERRLSVIQQAEAAVEANLIRAERLRQSILKSAFEGGQVLRPHG